MIDGETELIEALNQLRKYLLHKARRSVARIYLDWSVGSLAGYALTSYLIKLGGNLEPLIPVIWAVIGLLVLLDYGNNLQEVMRLQKILRIQVMEAKWKEQILGWGAAITVMFLINAAFRFGNFNVFMSSLLVMIGLGNVMTWLFTRRMIEPLLVGLALLIASPLPTILPDLSDLIVSLSISITYALAAVSISIRWRQEDELEGGPKEN